MNLTDITLIPTNCTADNNALVTGDPNLTVKTIVGQPISVDLISQDVELPFTVTEKGHVSFKPGTGDPTFPTGQCDVNITATFEQVPLTSTPPLQVQAAVSGTLCGKTIPAATTVPVGTF